LRANSAPRARLARGTVAAQPSREMGTVIDERNRARLEGTVRRTRAELESTLGELRGVMGESLDWRAWVRRHPWPSLALAAFVGLRLGRGRWF